MSKENKTKEVTIEYIRELTSRALKGKPSLGQSLIKSTEEALKHARGELNVREVKYDTTLGFPRKIEE